MENLLSESFYSDNHITGVARITGTYSSSYSFILQIQDGIIHKHRIMDQRQQQTGRDELVRIVVGNVVQMLECLLMLKRKESCLLHGILTLLLEHLSTDLRFF